jgi:hypothetical protein
MIKKIRFYFCIFLCLSFYGCTTNDSKDLVYQYILSSDSSISPDGQKFFFFVVYGTKYRKFTRPYVYDIANKNCNRLNEDDVYLSSKPDWDFNSTSLITTKLSENIQTRKDDEDEEGAFKELLRYLRKNEKFQEFEAKFKRKENFLPQICEIELINKNIRFIEDSNKEKLCGLSPKFSDDNNQIFYINMRVIEEEDTIENEVKFDLMQIDLSSGKVSTIIEDCNYDSFYYIHGARKFIFYKKEEPGVINLYDCKKKNSIKINFDTEKKVSVKDFNFKAGISWGIITTEDDRGFENIWEFDLNKEAVYKLNLSGNGWLCEPRIYSKNHIEYILNQKGSKKIVRYDIYKRDTTFIDISEIEGDIIDFNKETVFFIDHDNKLVSWSRDNQEKRIIFPENSTN